MSESERSKQFYESLEKSDREFMKVVKVTMYFICALITAGIVKLIVKAVCCLCI